MSDDEVFAFLVSGVISLAGMWVVVCPLLATRLMRPWWGRWAIVGSLVAGMALLLGMILTLAAKDVRAHAEYVALFMTEGLATVLLMMVCTPGIDVRGDALERRNGAAAFVACGSIAGVSLICAGSNIGEGPTIWTTIGPQFAGIGLWVGVWLASQVAAPFGRAVRLERDLHSGIRLGAMLAANGLVLGTAIAGDWVSVDELWQSLFAQGWPVVLLAATAVMLQWMFRPQAGKNRGLVSTAILPAITMTSAAAGWVIFLGKW